MSPMLIAALYWLCPMGQKMGWVVLLESFPPTPHFTDKELESHKALSLFKIPWLWSMAARNWTWVCLITMCVFSWPLVMLITYLCLLMKIRSYCQVKQMTLSQNRPYPYSHSLCHQRSQESTEIRNYEKMILGHIGGVSWRLHMPLSVVTELRCSKKKKLFILENVKLWRE
jgi:hypothetical protein